MCGGKIKDLKREKMIVIKYKLIKANVKTSYVE